MICRGHTSSALNTGAKRRAFTGLAAGIDESRPVARSACEGGRPSHTTYFSIGFYFRDYFYFGL